MRRRASDKLQHQSQAFIALAVFALVYLLGEFILAQESNRLFLDLRNQTLMQAASVRARLESELSSDIYLANGLLGYISATAPQKLPPGPTQNALAAVYRYGHHIRNIGLAPDNVLAHIYPLAGNEKAIGLNYQDSDQQWPAVRQAILTHDTVLAGPIELVQGGRGLVSRTPVYLADGRYWGIISIVLDADSFFRDIGRSFKDPSIRWAIRNTANNAMVYGDPAQFDQAAIRLPIRVPGAVWEMAAAPIQGWHAPNPRLTAWRVAALGLAAVLAALVYMLLTARQRIRLNDLQDALTGLPNLRLFDDRLEQAIQLHKRQGTGFALLSIDIDAFKRLNATYGQRTANLVLGEVALRLNSLTRHGDTLARVGGDEFMLILNGMESEADILRLTDKMQHAIAAPVHIGSVSLAISASFAAGFYPQDGDSPDILTGNVDLALYSGKQHGSGIVTFARQSRYAHMPHRAGGRLNSPPSGQS